jgi:hypothetical protein
VSVEQPGRAFSIPRRDALEVVESPFGAVGVVHRGGVVDVWWIWKDEEQVDPEWTIFSREDVLYVVQGMLKLELRDAPEVTLEQGDVFVIPAGAAFRGYRWPRDSAVPCLFVAVSPAGTETTKEPVATGAR